MSISWYDVGNLPCDVESAMTCSIMHGGEILELDEYGRSFEQIVEQVGYRENWNETEDWKEMFLDVFSCYYVTPFYQVIVYWSEVQNDYVGINLWR